MRFTGEEKKTDKGLNPSSLYTSDLLQLISGFMLAYANYRVAVMRLCSFWVGLGPQC